MFRHLKLEYMVHSKYATLIILDLNYENQGNNL